VLTGLAAAIPERRIEVDRLGATEKLGSYMRDTLGEAKRASKQNQR